MKIAASVILALTIGLAANLYGANPFLSLPDDKPVSAPFKGAEWKDDYGMDEIPMTGTVVTTRLAKMSWGEIYKIEFKNLKSRAPEQREILPDYYVVTDDKIVLLNEEDNDAAVKKIAAMETPPQFDEYDIYGIIKGQFTHKEGLWETKIEVKGDLCTYLSNHPSGHFKRVIWKKNVGLIEYASGYGAAKDGYRLKRVTGKKS
jgi:hypothetical protein